MRLLICGDPHVTIPELKECHNLLQYIFNLAIEYNPSYVLFLGDQFDNHSIVRLEVMKFWYDWLIKFKEYNIKTILIAGNHDFTGIKQDNSHSLLPYISLSNVVAEQEWLHEGILFVPYCHSDQDFLNKINKYPEAKLLVCHQTFKGAQFDNGFYAPDGIDLSLVPQRYVISGHLHNRSKFDKAWYPGTARWRNLNDANKEKGVYVVDFNEDLLITEIQSFNTKEICYPIYKFVDEESNPLDLDTFPLRGDINVEIHGSVDFIEERKAKYRDKNYKISTYPIQKTVEVIKESHGLNVSLKKWYDVFESDNKEKIKEYLNEKGFSF